MNTEDKYRAFTSPDLIVNNRSGDFLTPSLRASGHGGKPRLASRAAQPCTACIPARGLRPSEDKWLGQHGLAKPALALSWWVRYARGSGMPQTTWPSIQGSCAALRLHWPVSRADKVPGRFQACCGTGE
ncbi:hypothetical protein WJX75_000362 [Coccomyxa subellipsoidea]|uniref:Uncharacterized protein n=1 Tax=Coccomyxa subellipsoidea TaxID=248742 RepID=A0ABR2YH34_9CHLO